MKLAVLEALNEARHRREAAILVTDTASGAVRLVREADGFAGDPLDAELAARFALGRVGHGRPTPARS